jgi:TldD protein
MEKDIVDHCLEYAKSKKIDYAEAKAQDTNIENMVLKNGTLDAYSVALDSGFYVRILADGGLGFASSNKWTKEEAEKIVNVAYKLAINAKRKDKIKFAQEEAVKTNWEVKQKKKIENIPSEDKIGTLSEIDKTIMSQKINVAARMLILNIFITDKYFVNSEGSAISSYVPKINAQAIGITVVDQGKMEQLTFKEWGYSGGWEAFDTWKLDESLAKEVKVLAKVLKEGKPIKPGKTDLICGPEVTGIASHESCGHPMEADRILGREMSQAGRSFIYQGGPYWIGTRIGSTKVTIVDDPTLENSYGYYLYDDEGIKARPRNLYKNGIINEFLQNRETAAKLGTRSNGASRSMNYDREAIVRMANTFLQPGDMSEQEIFEDVKQGIYMHSFTEWNIDDVRFNQRYVGREAYFIENGELKGPVMRPTIETTTLNFWTSVDAVSKKLDFVSATCGKGDPSQGAPVYTGGPMMRLKGVHVK